MFYGGFGVNFKAARPAAVKAVLLSSVGVVLTAGFTGLFVHFVLGLDILESVLIGAVISSTDAASVFNILKSKKLDLKYNTASLLELESGSNDPVSYMITAVVITLISGQKVSVPRQYTGNSLKSLDLSGKGELHSSVLDQSLDHLKCVENNEKTCRWGALLQIHSYRKLHNGDNSLEKKSSGDVWKCIHMSPDFLCFGI